MKITLDLIKEGDGNLRPVDTQNPEFLRLVDSIQAEGLLSPISVMPYVMRNPENPEVIDFEGYRIVDGLHRLYAAKALDWDEIECNVVEVRDTDDLAKKQIAGNLQRINTKPHEYAKKLKELMNSRPTMTPAQFAKELNCTVEFLNGRLGLLRLTPDIGTLVDRGEIKLGNASRLASLPASEQPSWVDEARTSESQAFAARVEARLKEINQERRAQGPVEPTFEPRAYLRKPAEVVDQIENSSALMSLISANGVTDPLEAARLALKWVTHLDEESVSVAKAEFDAQQQKRKEDQERRKADALQKKREAALKKLAEIDGTAPVEG